MVDGSSPADEKVGPNEILGPLPVPVFVAGAFKSNALYEVELLLTTTEPTEVKFLELKFTLLPVGFRVKSPAFVVIGLLICTLPVVDLNT